MLIDASAANPVLYTKDDGLPTDLTTAIAADASYVWVATPKALACYDRQARRWLTVRQANSCRRARRSAPFSLGTAGFEFVLQTAGSSMRM